ncbi:CHAD domain-containing protein [Aquihabitans daechungensis]|uniref:CHAD domain-containing protein n=1 Tax=Aquihabitans daechungensis TaxID=1052257 RepID=UPI003B9EE246
MAYRIDPGEPVVGEIRRILRDQLDRAVADLRGPNGTDAESIHDARRRIKKARSALRLSRALFGARVTRLANAELRAVARSIAPQRDADARVEAVDRILGGLADGDPARPAIELVRRHSAVAAEAQRSAGSVDTALAHGAARRLQQTGDWLQRVPTRSDGWEALEEGLRRQYARGRRQLRHLGSAPGDDERHDWRKRAKDLWYHERLLKDLWPAGQKPYVRTASALADLLGDDHDLSLVRSFVEADDQLGPDDRHTALDVIDARRADLLAEARALGALVYADHPSAWADRHGTWWALRREAGDG